MSSCGYKESSYQFEYDIKYSCKDNEPLIIKTCIFHKIYYDDDFDDEVIYRWEDHIYNHNLTNSVLCCGFISFELIESQSKYNYFSEIIPKVIINDEIGLNSLRISFEIFCDKYKVIDKKTIIKIHNHLLKIILQFLELMKQKFAKAICLKDPLELLPLRLVNLIKKNMNECESIWFYSNYEKCGSFIYPFIKIEFVKKFKRKYYGNRYKIERYGIISGLPPNTIRICETFPILEYVNPFPIRYFIKEKDKKRKENIYKPPEKIVLFKEEVFQKRVKGEGIKDYFDAKDMFGKLFLKDILEIYQTVIKQNKMILKELQKLRSAKLSQLCYQVSYE